MSVDRIAPAPLVNQDYRSPRQAVPGDPPTDRRSQLLEARVAFNAWIDALLDGRHQDAMRYLRVMRQNRVSVCELDPKGSR